MFVRAPVPGTVKTRLVPALGETAATRLYRILAHRVVDRVRGGPWQTVVCFDPPEERARVEDWLGPDVQYWPQVPGDLGARMSDAIAAALQRADRVCVIGSDIPALDQRIVRGAFTALDDADLVLGPARDGGYYLLATSTWTPELFRDIPWSTAGVLEATEHRSARQGLRVRRIETLADIDTPADLDGHPDLVRLSRGSGTSP